MMTPNPTAPPVQRTPMRPRPWFGLWRGLLFALLPGLNFRDAAVPAPWLAAARARRRVLLAAVLLLGAVVAALTPEGTPWPQAALQTLLFIWVGAGFVTALMGAWVLLRGDAHALKLKPERAPIARGARTAIVMPICNEDLATVFAGLAATCESLAATGALGLFDIYLLSDSADPALRAAELEAWQRLREQLGDSAIGAGGRIFYRWRRRRTRRKAGNVADFCRRWGSRYRYMVVLDADSTMHGDTLVSLVRLMEQHPRIGILQTLPSASGHNTLHARLQQFASRVTGRLFSLGMAYWQLGESHYWGHNAILRVQPFMQHCALAPIRGRGGLAGDILSHDFVEAALMRRAGYEVWLAPDLGGSWEQHPPNLLAELQRDRRWCQGNLQNARLLAEPGWRPVHRVMFATGALSYAIAPLWLLFVALGLLSRSPSPGVVAAGALWLLTLTLLLLPRVLGVGAILLARGQHAFGGTLRLLGGALAEALLSALQAPLRLVAHSMFVLSALTGLRLEWKSPPREAGSVRWRDALARVGLPSWLALAAVALARARGASAAWSLVPLLLPLALAVPFTVATGSESVGRRVRRAGWLGTPEEREPPRALARASSQHGFKDLMPRAGTAVAAVATTTTATTAATAAGAAAPWRQRAALAFGVVVMLSVAVMPRPGAAPGLSQALQAEREADAFMRGLPALQVAASGGRRSSASARRVVLPPAARIDDSVRARALESVARALGQEDYERLIWSLARAAAIAP